jgi:sialic acid synthase SpsE
MVEIVAEIGINHNGHLLTAIEMIKQAKDCGADTCKFQAFMPDLTYDGMPSLLPVLRATQLCQSDLEVLKAECQKQRLKFLCSAFDRPSIDMLVAMGEKRIKIPSSRNTIPEYLNYVNQQPFDEILYSCGAAGISDFRTICLGSLFDRHRLVPIECISSYPCSPEDYVFNRNTEAAWGLSDHSTTNTACIMAAAYGACYLEKHFTLNRKLDGPDHAISLDPSQFSEFVTAIRTVEKIQNNQ